MKRERAYILAILLAFILVSQIRATNTKTISIRLEYKSGSVWDSDDDGIESDKAAIDFTVENTQFSRNFDESKLCTKWEIYSLDNEEATMVCYGGTKCCNFIDLSPGKPKWNDVLYLQYKKYGASMNNKISARIIYVDYSLDAENPYSDIYYSEEDYLYAVYLDNNYFKNALANDATSNKAYINALSSFEKLKEKNKVGRIILTDTKDNKIEEDLKNKELKMKMYVDEGIIISINNFKEEDLNWNNLEKVLLKTENEIINERIKNLNLIPRKSITLNKIGDVLEEGKYNGIVEFDVERIAYDGVIYCNDYYQCFLMEKCKNAEENCYKEEDDKVEVFIPHFSSVVLVLNKSSVNLDIISPEINSTLESGENVYLDFTTNITVSAGYSFDSEYDVGLGSGNYFSSKLNGLLQFGVIENGRHNLTIYLMDNNSDIMNYSYSFTVDDTTAPDIDVSMDNKELNNSIIDSTNNPIEVRVASNEYGNISYKVNDGWYVTSDLGEEKSTNINLTLEEGINSLTIYASDMQGNSKLNFYIFNFTLLPSCSDGTQNGDETGIDCGGSCDGCIPFDISLEKNIFDLGEYVKVTVLSRANSAVNLTVLLDGSIIDNEYITSYSPDYPIYVSKTINNINQEGNYTINAAMHYMSHRENKILYFYVNDTSPNPLTVSINANATTINEGQTIGFSATVTGNTNSVTYNWNFGDGSTSTEENPKHTYNTNGTYDIDLNINWGEWTKSATQTITVRKEFNVSIIVKNESGQVIEDAKVEFDNIEKNTSSNGIASFLVNSGDRKLSVSKEDYNTFSNTTKIDINTTIGVKLLYYGYDNKKPIIQLSKPDEKETITQSDVTISYRVIDSYSVNCTLYINMDGGWWIEKAYEKDITTSSERSFLIEDLENRHYQWKIECIDKFGNSQISETRNFYVNSTITIEDASIDQIIEEIDNSLSNLEYLDKNEREAALALDLEKQLEKAKTELQRAKRDLHNLVWRRLNDTEEEEVRNSILDRIKGVKKTAIKTIKVMESKEFVDYPSKEDVSNISFILLERENKKYRKREKEAYADYNQELQNLISITTKLKIIEVDYIAGEKGEITLIEKEIKAEENLRDISLIEVIPKSIAANTSYIHALFDYSIILEDPTIKLNMPIEKYVYYINKKIELSDIKEIKSVLVSNDIIKKNPIIGFAIFGDFTSKLVESSNIRLAIEIIIILILVVVYVGFSGSFKKVKYLIKDRNVIKNIKEINQSVENALTNLQNNQYEKAKSIYKDINQIFKQLPKEMKKGVYNKIVLLSSRLDVFHINKLIDKALFSLENNQSAAASSVYKQVSQIYKDISPKFKSNVLERCNELHKRLNELSLDKT